MEYNILLRLLCVHFLLDFLLQPTSMVKNKTCGTTSKRIRYNLLHSFLHAVVAYLIVGAWASWYIPAVIFVSHFAIDFWYKRDKKGLQPFLIDQLLHIVVLMAVWLFCTNQFSVIGNQISSLFTNNNVWIILIAYILILKPASTLLSIFIQKWSKQLNDEDISLKEKGLKDAGLWIGYIERFLVVTFILAGTLEPIGFLLAAKSIFRYGNLKELNEIKMTEYVLIGTLASFSIAIVVGVLFKYCLL